MTQRFRNQTTCIAALALLAIALPETPAFADFSTRDRETERFLREARVVEIREMVPGTTSPMALDLELGGKTGVALFKYRKRPRSGSGRDELGATDDSASHGYRFEVAAYRLDRMLGLEMVPVAVIRNVKTEGALIEWIAGGMSERLLQDLGEPVKSPKRLSRQRSVMNLFDALIANPDRSEDDQLIVPALSKLHLIDHGRAFGDARELPSSFTAKRASLPRDLLDQLENLEKGSLKNQLEGLLTNREIQALLNRRDAILKKIAADRKRYGDSKVFQD